MKPSIGRVVHYVNFRGVHMAAIVTSLAEGLVDSGNVTLTVFPAPVDGIEDPQVPVPYDPDGSAMTWHWPERED